jgi:hypothetical protein
MHPSANSHILLEQWNRHPVKVNLPQEICSCKQHVQKFEYGRRNTVKNKNSLGKMDTDRLNNTKPPLPFLIQILFNFITLCDVVTTKSQL